MALILPEYPAAPGHRLWIILDVAGPSSYTQITPGVPPAGPTGGQTVTSPPGFKWGEFVWSMGSTSGTYAVNVFFGTPQAGQPSTGITLQWIVATTGAEAAGATNLSTENARLMILGL